MNQGQYCLDASVLITAWNELFPMDVIPTFWSKLSKHKQKILLIEPIFNEIDPISTIDKDKTSEEKLKKYPLRMWLMLQPIAGTPVDDEVESNALLLERKYEINEHTKGANRNDILLIAYAKLYVKTIVTLEKLQFEIPHKKSNYKIPLIADMEDVKCIDLIELLRRLNIKI